MIGLNPRLSVGLLLLLFSLVILLPLGIIVVTSFGMDWQKASPTLSFYKSAWQQGHFLLAFANSTLVALVVTTGQIITSALGGYALARLRFWGRHWLLLLLIATLVIPFQLLVIPIFLVLKWGHLINTYFALILPTIASGYGLFLLRQAFLTVPVELEESAFLEGATRLQVLYDILLPLVRPSLTTLFLLTFIGEWNNLFKPLIFTTKTELRTVQLALASLQEEFSNNWSLLMAAVVMVTIPVILLFLGLQKQFIQGISDTGMKGE